MYEVLFAFLFPFQRLFLLSVQRFFDLFIFSSFFGYIKRCIAILKIAFEMGPEIVKQKLIVYFQTVMCWKFWTTNFTCCRYFYDAVFYVCIRFTNDAISNRYSQLSLYLKGLIRKGPHYISGWLYWLQPAAFTYKTLSRLFVLPTFYKLFLPMLWLYDSRYITNCKIRTKFIIN